jgi:uncharacterized protein (DUF58 family)
VAQLLSAAESAWLTRMQLPWQGLSPQGLYAVRAARQGGRSNEPELLRPYQMGDDVRRVDWAATQRLQHAMVRQPLPQSQGRMRIVLDASPSMRLDPAKWHQALRIVAALGVVATSNGDSVQLWHENPSPLYHRTDAWLALCDGIYTAAPTTHQFVMPTHVPQTQLAVWCSDLWHADWALQLVQFATTTQTGLVIQLLSAAEIVPPLYGDVTLIDSETQQEYTMTVDAALQSRYQAAYTTWQHAIRHECRRLGLGYLFVATEADLATALHEVLL